MNKLYRALFLGAWVFLVIGGIVYASHHRPPTAQATTDTQTGESFIKTVY